VRADEFAKRQALPHQMRSAGMLNRSFLFLKIDLSSQRTVRILPSMSELQRLRQEGFELASQWRSPECRVHRGAFPGSEKADQLHRRLRNYSNRCFASTGGKAPRVCHAGIMQAVGTGRTVYVYARAAEPKTGITNAVLEDRLIRELRPIWNRTHQGFA
jgi:hypothetical protein